MHTNKLNITRMDTHDSNPSPLNNTQYAQPLELILFLS